MPDEIALMALQRKRSELAGELIVTEKKIAELRFALESLDTTIRLFDPAIPLHKIRPVVKRRRNSSFPVGAWTRTILGILRKAPSPLTVREIAQQVAAEHGIDISLQGAMNRMANRVRNTLGKQKPGLLVQDWRGDVMVWRIA